MKHFNRAVIPGTAILLLGLLLAGRSFLVHRAASGRSNEADVLISPNEQARRDLERIYGERPRETSPRAALDPGGIPGSGRGAAASPSARPPATPAPAVLPAADATLAKLQRAAQAPMDKPFSFTDQLILYLAPGADPVSVGKDFKIEPLRSLVGQPDIWVFRAGSVEEAKTARVLAAADPRVTAALPNRRLRMSKFYIPNDPYYPPGTPTAGFPGQWHLVRANLPAIWDDGTPTHTEVTGAGVVLAIEDDELEFTHPDLAGNFDAADSLNFGPDAGQQGYGPDTANDGTAAEDRHGTSVGGVAAAVGGNGIGVTGAAPHALLAINRIDFNSGDDTQFINGCLYNSVGANPSIKVKNHSYGFQSTYVDDSGESSAVSTSAAAGTVHVYAAANSRGFAGEDSNTLMPQNSPDVVTVAALGSDDKFAVYSNFGACVLVTAPSSSSSTLNGVTTTDRMGNRGYNPNVFYNPDGTVAKSDTFPDQNYTSQFGGTSSAAPLVSGILALGKQANPAMTVRMAQHALVRSSSIVDPTDSTKTGGGDGSTSGSAWILNGASPTRFAFNQNYGFGVVDAAKFVKEVVKYTGVSEAPPETHSVTFPSPITLPDPPPGDNPLTPVTQTFTVTSTTPLEAIQVGLNINHAYRGDIAAYITSPRGTKCRLVINELGDSGTLPDPGWFGIAYWTFTSYAFWGENPSGTWTLSVVDTDNGVQGTWAGYTFTAYMGTPILDTTPPTVLSINRADPDMTSANPLHFTVKFSEYVTGVDVSDFTLTTTGTIAGASIVSVSGGVDTYTVTVNPGNGIGTITLNLIDNDTIVDGAGNKLGGTGLGNGSFTTGQAYTYDDVPPTISVGSSTPDGNYGLNSQINITLNFSSALTLSGGNLQITLDTGAVLSIPPFAGQTSVGATYTVAAGEHSSDLTVVSPLALSAGTLQDAFGNNAVLTIAPGSDLAAAHAIVVDAVPPVGGTVLDGLSGADISTQTSLTTISAHWSGFSDTGTGIAGYRWAIGTFPGAQNVLPYADVGLGTVASTSFFNQTLSLSVGATYYVAVEARDFVGNVSVATSNGVQVVAGGSTLVPEPPGRLNPYAQATSISLVWTASPTVGVSGYRLWWKPTASPWTSATLVDNIATLSTTVSGLTTGTSYDFQLRALMPGGNESTSVYATSIAQFPITISGTSYATVQAALTAAAAGQTVLVQGGTYTGNLTIPDGVNLQGVSPRLTVITATSGDVITAAATATTSTISMLTVTGGANGINAGTAPVTIKNVVIHHTGASGVLSAASTSLLQVINCTIAHCGAQGVDAGGTTTVRNVISEGNAGIGIKAPSAALVTYTDSYSNSSSFSGGFSASLDYSVPVLFTNEGANDYTEAPGSASIDSGDPSDDFSLEPYYNGGRINLGAYGDTADAATSPLPVPAGGGGGGGGCGLTGLEVFLCLGLLRRRTRRP